MVNQYSRIQASPVPSSSDLKSSQVAFYQREGYLLPPHPIFADADFRALKRVCEELIAEYSKRGLRPEGMNWLHFYYPELMRWLLHPALLDVLESIIGPDILLYSTHLFCKPPGDGARVPWHDDSNYWQNQWDPMEVVGVWLAIDDADLENGCMQVIPRTHRERKGAYGELRDRPPGERNFFAEELPPGSFDDSAAVPCILPAGFASLHHNMLIHGSGANTSTRRRCGYAMRYISAAARFNPERCAERVDPERKSQIYQIYQARGRNIAGNTLSDPSRRNQAWIDRFGYYRL